MSKDIDALLSGRSINELKTILQGSACVVVAFNCACSGGDNAFAPDHGSYQRSKEIMKRVGTLLARNESDAQSIVAEAVSRQLKVEDPSRLDSNNISMRLFGHPIIDRAAIEGQVWLEHSAELISKHGDTPAAVKEFNELVEERLKVLRG